MYTVPHKYELHALAVVQVILKEREERKQNRLQEERDPARTPSEVNQESQAIENLTESSSAAVQQCHEPTGTHVVMYYTHAILCVCLINI